MTRKLVIVLLLSQIVVKANPRVDLLLQRAKERRASINKSLSTGPIEVKESPKQEEIQPARTAIVEIQQDKIAPVAEIKQEIQQSPKLEKKAEETAIKPTLQEPLTQTSSEKKPDETRNILNSEGDYILLMRKCLKSLEEDSWTQVKYNMKEALDYFAREKQNHPDLNSINIYYQAVQSFMKFAQGGLELDQGDDANFDEAEGLYLDAQDSIQEIQKSINQSKDPSLKNLASLLDTVLKYINEDLDYIENMQAG